MFLSKKNTLLFSFFVFCVSALGLYIYLQNNQTTLGYRIEEENREANKRQLLAFTEQDIVFNPGKKVSIIVYEDTDCEFCKKYTETLEKVLTSRAEKVSLAFRYRFLPIYPHSRDEGLFLECIKNLAPEKYTAFKHTLFEIPSSKEWNPELLFESAHVYVEKDALEACLADENTLRTISDIEGVGAVLGVTTVPRTFIVSANAPIVSLAGAQSQRTLESIIDTFAK